MSKKEKISGTKEWASHTANCCLGCSSGCRYCFAKYDAVKRWKTVSKASDWKEEKINWKNAKKKQEKKNGTTMFPTTHDISPNNLDACVMMLENLLSIGNDVLIVSKPHLECIKILCDNFAKYKEQILFRFTIGAYDNDTLKFWEPGAPSFGERYDCLQLAYNKDFRTSVSCEPLLDGECVTLLFDMLSDYVTDSIWIGKMNKSDKRILDKNDNEIKSRLEDVLKWQTDEMIWKIYDELKGEELVKWKESIKKVVGLKLADEKGLDI